MPLILDPRPPAFRRAGTAAFALLLAGLASGGPATGGELPRSEAELVETVKAALLNRDMAALEALVNWDGARPFRKRAVKAQISTALGRPIKSVALEPFPPDGLQEAESRGTLKANMPVSHQLRVVFDEPAGPSGGVPTDLFLIGRNGDDYRITLVVPVPKKSD
jgi:hypothetical protein